MHAFLTVALIHLLAVASPGPDFAVIVKQSVTQSRSVARWTAFGLSLGILLHVAYSLLGIGLLISQSILLFNLLKYAGAAYLVYVGVKGLLTKRGHGIASTDRRPAATMRPPQAIRLGFLCNALNPKATVFFVALFTQVIDPSTSLWVQTGYGLYMGAATFAWFSLVGSVLTLEAVRRRLDAAQHWIERVMGAVLVALGIRVALAGRE